MCPPHDYVMLGGAEGERSPSRGVEASLPSARFSLVVLEILTMMRRGSTNLNPFDPGSLMAPGSELHEIASSKTQQHESTILTGPDSVYTRY